MQKKGPKRVTWEQGAIRSDIAQEMFDDLRGVVQIGFSREDLQDSRIVALVLMDEKTKMPTVIPDARVDRGLIAAALIKLGKLVKATPNIQVPRDETNPN
jgi:hypothetical protein